ncbi:BNR repeat-containing protein [Haloarcula laminariae]|uniref:BNR repeat-containing protein n=1 Tax=Haloarcula laminariae TaxID=2961577 RepID=UPI0021C600BA|nr:BNR repeat-containing protein [Halomicroarcula laminariae]
MIPDRDASWTWHQDPRAVHIEGKTYLGYVDQRGNIKAYSYNHDADEAREAILHANLIRDDHVAPILYERDDGRFICQYARNETGLLQRISARPHDIRNWRPEQTIGNGDWNYPNPVCYDGDIHLLARAGIEGLSDYEQYRFISSDGGETWSSPTQVTLFDDRAYLKVASFDDTRYYLALTSATDTQPNQAFCIYYEDGAYYELDGTQVGTSGLPLTESDLSSLYTVDGDAFGGLRIWDIVTLAADDVRILLADVDDTSNHIYKEARWDGSSWAVETIVESGASPVAIAYYSGGLCYAGGDTDTVYLSQNDGGTHEVYTATRDGGSWPTTQVTSSSADDQWRPMRVRNGRSDMPAVWLSVQDFRTFTKYRQTVTSELAGTEQPPTPVPPRKNPARDVFGQTASGEIIRLRSVRR